jgi:peroxiredoxin
MLRPLLCCLLAALSAGPALAALNEGDAAPAFTAPASRAGQTLRYSLADALGHGPVVVYFYPSAYTNGCNVQAHAFAVNHDQFTAAGASIVGVSLDSIARLNDFAADPQTCAGKLTVASDAEGRIARAYDLTVREATPGRKDTRGVSIDHGYAERTTFIVRPDGRIAATVGGLGPAENVARALQVVRTLADRAR